MASVVVVDASSVVDLLLSSDRAPGIVEATAGCIFAAPAHIDEEVLTALARLQRAGASAVEMRTRVEILLTMPLERHALPPLVRGAWARQANLSIADGFYVELAEQLGANLVTCDRGMAAATSRAILVT